MGLDKVRRSTNLRHCWIGLGILALVTLLLALGGDDAREAMAWNRTALEAGEFWRLLTGHFVHLSLKHLLLNLAGLALVVWIVGHAYTWSQWLFVLFLSIVAINAGFWFIYTDLDWYVGISGFLNGILAAGLVVGVADREPESIALALIVLVKLTWEQAVGPMPGSVSTSGGAVIVDAHIYGAAGGLLAAAILWRRVRSNASI
ncbi:MAG: rhombosortase [Gammaproteobacteria bacterium]|jgi:rhomboid family GlyGly-CTERM serine protease|nr:rhombosortase [Gammaproteobacteria bacterium]